MKNGTAEAVSDFQHAQRNLSILYRPLAEINGVQIFMFRSRTLSYIFGPFLIKNRYLVKTLLTFPLDVNIEFLRI